MKVLSAIKSWNTWPQKKYMDKLKHPFWVLTDQIKWRILYRKRFLILKLRKTLCLSLTATKHLAENWDQVLHTWLLHIL